MSWIYCQSDLKKTVGGDLAPPLPRSWFVSTALPQSLRGPGAQPEGRPLLLSLEEGARGEGALRAT